MFLWSELIWLGLNDMKDLISVFAYCPDIQRKNSLFDLIKKLQQIRNNFDILLVSHSTVPELILSQVDFAYIDNENYLITDFDLRNKFWFKSNKINVESTLVYPPSTHFAIYSLMHYVINFSSYRGYKKIHCLEYDIHLNDLNLIIETNNKLEEVDTIFFGDENWCYGTYFAFKNENFPPTYFKHDKNFILNGISLIKNRMTEDYTKKFLTVNNRSFLIEPHQKLDPEGIFQTFDNHNNNELNWCVPVYEIKTDFIYFFIFNEKGFDFEIDIIYNNKQKHFSTIQKSHWILEPIEKLSSIKNFTTILNGKIKYSLVFDESNVEKFKKNNFILYK